MGDDRLGDLATLSINRERTAKIEMDEIVDIFDRSGNRRIRLKLSEVCLVYRQYSRRHHKVLVLLSLKIIIIYAMF